tara:strand:- start:7077 stop:7313 length:237 start_codon:yes stop_codon:yes gene_type:complete
MLKRLAVPLKEANRHSIYGDEGRIFLVAAAFPNYEVDEKGNILLSDGTKMDSKHPDYNSIIEDAMKQAGNEGSVGRIW